MDRADAYAVLATELERWRHRSFDEVARLVGTQEVQTLRARDEDITVTIRVEWSSELGRDVIVRAAAEGPSTWRLERLEERLIIRRSK